MHSFNIFLIPISFPYMLCIHLIFSFIPVFQHQRLKALSLRHYYRKFTLFFISFFFDRFFVSFLFLYQSLYFSSHYYYNYNYIYIYIYILSFYFSLHFCLYTSKYDLFINEKSPYKYQFVCILQHPVIYD